VERVDSPGDVIVGDADGVLVIPPRLIEDVVDAAIAQEAEEEFILAMVKQGEKVDTLYPMDTEWKKRFETWREGKKK
jgi:regulator of RNase E activity RraA